MTDLKEIWQANAEGVSEVHGSKKLQFLKSKNADGCYLEN